MRTSGGADLREADLIQANLWEANFSGADLSGADLQQAAMVRTDVTDANLDSCHVYGIAVWDLMGTPKSQRNLVITPSYALEPAITVDGLEVAQLMYLLLRHEKLRNVINAVTQRGVLILGRFSGGGLQVLQAIAQKLRDEKYLPVIFDFDRPEGRDYTETVKTLVGLSRFVIVDLSGPSVPQELYATVPHFDIPFIPIVEATRRPPSTVSDLFKYPWFLPPIVEFGTKEELIELMASRLFLQRRFGTKRGKYCWIHYSRLEDAISYKLSRVSEEAVPQNRDFLQVKHRPPRPPPHGVHEIRRRTGNPCTGNPLTGLINTST